MRHSNKGYEINGCYDVICGQRRRRAESTISTGRYYDGHRSCLLSGVNRPERFNRIQRRKVGKILNKNGENFLSKSFQIWTQISRYVDLLHAKIDQFSADHGCHHGLRLAIPWRCLHDDRRTGLRNKSRMQIIETFGRRRRR